jgi:hypothetical protein
MVGNRVVCIDYADARFRAQLIGSLGTVVSCPDMLIGGERVVVVQWDFVKSDRLKDMHIMKLNEIAPHRLSVS